MATKPATAPLATPSTVGLPRAAHSLNTQARAAAAVAAWVAIIAEAAKPLAARALPALKPNQPTHSRPAPVSVMVRLWGGIGRWGKPMRRPMTSAAIRAETPEEI